MERIILTQLTLLWEKYMRYLQVMSLCWLKIIWKCIMYISSSVVIIIFKYRNGCCEENLSNNLGCEWEIAVKENCSIGFKRLGKLLQISMMPAARDWLSKAVTDTTDCDASTATELVLTSSWGRATRQDLMRLLSADFFSTNLHLSVKCSVLVEVYSSLNKPMRLVCSGHTVIEASLQILSSE